MRVPKVLYWVLDLAWPTLEPPTKRRVLSRPKWEGISRNSCDVIQAAFDLMKDELKSQDDEIRLIESKLQSISSLTPVVSTILVAIVAFLTGGRVHQFAEPSVLTMVIGACYVVSQLLRALLASIGGLRRRSFSAVSVSDIRPTPGQTKTDYLLHLCKELSIIADNNREIINGKVDQLELGHVAVRNAVAGLLVTLAVVLAITILETKSYVTGIALFLLCAVAIAAMWIVRAVSKE